MPNHDLRSTLRKVFWGPNGIRAGWRVLQEQEIDSEKRYFLRYEISRSAQRDVAAHPAPGC